MYPPGLSYTTAPFWPRTMNTPGPFSTKNTYTEDTSTPDQPHLFYFSGASGQRARRWSFSFLFFPPGFCFGFGCVTFAWPPHVRMS